MRQHAMFRARDSHAADQQGGLFGKPILPSVPPVRDYTRAEKLAAEKEILGFVVSVHPLRMFAGLFRRSRTVMAVDLPQHVGRTVQVAGWQVTRKRLRTKQKEPMAFVTFEDETALYETVIFPREYRRAAPLIAASGPFVVTGEVTEELGALTITVTDLRLLAETREVNEHIPEKTIWWDEQAAWCHGTGESIRT
jgi:DNA polymerase III alpha subunit